MTTDKPTAVEFAAWMPLSEVLSRVKAAQGNNAYWSVLQRLVDGLLQAYAESFIAEDGPLRDITVVSQEVWSTFIKTDRWKADPVWVTSDLEVYFYESAYGGTNYRFYSIRIAPKAFWKIFPGVPRPPQTQKPSTPLSGAAKPTLEATAVNSAPSPAPIPPSILTPPKLPLSRAGRPSKDFWEDMVIAATRAILYDDSLKPKTIADVQRWMAEWAIAKGHGDPGETALKERARKVFLACQE